MRCRSKLPGNILAAGKQLLAFIGDQPRQRRLLFLISGGSSSLAEDIRDGLQPGDLQRANRWLLGNGLDIVAMNQVRLMLSTIKGGRLLQYLDGRTASALLLSDVIAQGRCRNLPCRQWRSAGNRSDRHECRAHYDRHEITS